MVAFIIKYSFAKQVRVRAWDPPMQPRGKTMLLNALKIIQK